MIMRSIATAKRAHVLLPAALAIAGAAVLAPAPAREQAVTVPQHVAFAAADDGLPGDGRPPSPGPTDPYGAY
ncbi:MAG TPA: hypothetical protein VH913_15375 [Hyphomicrobiaceae bacterium]|jgi:hypothetical protein